MKLSCLLPLLSLPAYYASAQPNPNPVSGSTFVHDPSICKDNNGTYFLFWTGPRINIVKSTDKVNWEAVGTVFPPGDDTWTDQYTLTSDGNIWAPDCHYVNGEFLLYYAASSFGSQNSGIFLAKSKSGAQGTWTNEGLVISTKTGDSYNAIDPNLFIDSSGGWFMNMGSFWTGIKQTTISPSTGKPSNRKTTSLAKRTTSGGAIEASYMFEFSGFYYLFTSWGLCCKGTSSTYNIRVVRSTSPNGSFKDQSDVDALAGGGTLVLGTHDAIIGPGGQSVFMDDDGPMLVYHYYTPSGSFLGLNRLDFSSGWPVVV